MVQPVSPSQPPALPQPDSAPTGVSGPTGRRFCRLSLEATPANGTWPVPPDGLCLSSFLLLSPAGRSKEVLVGKLDPRAPWAEIGALDPRRVTLNASGWMLPSCHLLYFESPETAARRVASEQLGIDRVELEAPRIFSEAYRPARHPERGEHWDIEFLYRGVAPAHWRPRHSAWVELKFLDPSATARAEFTRSHDQVLELAGFAIG